MTVTELESIIQEHKKDLEEDAEASEKTYIFMTYKDGAGMMVSAGAAKAQATMALNILEVIAKQASTEMVLDGISTLGLELMKDEFGELKDEFDELEEAEHEKVDNRTIS